MINLFIMLLIYIIHILTLIMWFNILSFNFNQLNNSIDMNIKFLFFDNLILFLLRNLINIIIIEWNDIIMIIKIYIILLIFSRRDFINININISR